MNRADREQTLADQSTIEEIAEHCEKLAQLLRFPEPGLLTWASFRAQRAAKLFNALAEVADPTLVEEDTLMKLVDQLTTPAAKGE